MDPTPTITWFMTQGVLGILNGLLMWLIAKLWTDLRADLKAERDARAADAKACQDDRADEQKQFQEVRSRDQATYNQQTLALIQKINESVKEREKQ